MANASQKRSPRRTAGASMSPGMALVMGQQWAISEAGWRALLHAATATPTMLQVADGDRVEDARCTTIRDGIATISIRGPLLCYANWLSRCFGWSNYEDLAADYSAALVNPAVRAIVFEVDSPGGSVTGVSELAALLFANRDIKPQAAFVTGLSCSAAMWLTAAVGHITVADVALLGAIGTMFSYRDTTKFDKTIGIEERTIISRQSPKKNMDPSTPEGHAEMQGIADDLTDVFIAAMSDYRDVARDDVMEQFGEGGIMVGASAVAAGLADAVGTQAQLITSLLAELDEPPSLSAALPAFGGRASTTPKSEGSMTRPSTRADRRSASPSAAADATEATATMDDTDKDPADTGKTDNTKGKAKAKSAAKGKAAAKPADDEEPDESDAGDDPDDEDDDEEDDAANKDKAKSKAKATTADLVLQAKADERSRIAKIRALDGPADVIQACVDDAECTPEAAAYRLMTRDTAAPKKGASRLAQLRQDDAGPHASATPGASAAPSTPKAAAKASVDRFYSLTKPTMRKS